MSFIPDHTSALRAPSTPRKNLSRHPGPVPKTAGPLAARLCPGDLLFQYGNEQDPFSRAIRNVTVGVGGAGFAHVGLFASREEQGLVLEALPEKGVIATPLNGFLARCGAPDGRPAVVVGRLKRPWQRLAGPAVARAATLVGRPYNEVFDLEHEGYYCAELIYEAFRAANRGHPVFPLRPMAFKNPDIGVTCPLWQAYFAHRGIPVPEGRPGLNPGDLSLSDKIEILSLPAIPRG